MGRRRAWGHVFQRKRKGRKGPWCIRYRDAHGRERFETIGPSKQLAKERLAQLHADVTEELVTGRRQLRMVTFRELWDEVVRPYFRAHHAPETFASESRRAAIVAEKLGTKRVAELTEGDLRKLLANLRLARNWSGATVNRYRVLLARAWDLAIACDMAEENPIRNIEAAREPEAERDRVPPGDVERLLAALTPRFHPPIVLLAETGARRGEIANARWRWYDARSGTLTVPGTGRKNGRAHVLYLSDRAVRILEALRAERGPVSMFGREDFIFPEFSGGSARKLTQAWARARRKVAAPPGRPGRPRKGEKPRPKKHRLKMAGLPGSKLHGLRHAVGDALAAQGESIATIQAALGHRSRQTTLRYVAGRDQEAVAQAMQRLAKARARATDGPADGATDGAKRDTGS